MDESVAIRGMAAVRQVVGDVFAKTPEFASRYAYRFYRFWSCGTDFPFVWDGRCGDGWNTGRTQINPADIVAVYAPMPNTLSASGLATGGHEATESVEGE